MARVLKKGVHGVRVDAADRWRSLSTVKGSGLADSGGGVGGGGDGEDWGGVCQRCSAISRATLTPAPSNHAGNLNKTANLLHASPSTRAVTGSQEAPQDESLAAEIDTRKTYNLTPQELGLRMLSCVSRSVLFPARAPSQVPGGNFMLRRYVTLCE